MNSNVLSVIVPVYNSETYLHKCINSIINQTYNALEIVLVDDGSTDSSGEICDFYADMYENIVCIHKKNEGACYARRDGVRMAKGDYVGFVDSDDWIESSMYQVLMDKVIHDNLDIITSGFCFDNGSQLCDLEEEGIYRNEECKKIIDNMIYDSEKMRSNILCSVWTKIYKKSLIAPELEKLPENIHVWEDLLYVYIPFLRAKSIGITHNTFYHYVQHEDSISHKRNLKLYSETKYSFQMAEKQYGMCNEKTITQLKQLCLHCLLVVLKDDFLNRPLDASLKEYIMLLKDEAGDLYIRELFHGINEKEAYIPKIDKRICTVVCERQWYQVFFKIRGEQFWEKIRIFIQTIWNITKKIVN